MNLINNTEIKSLREEIAELRQLITNTQITPMPSPSRSESENSLYVPVTPTKLTQSSPNSKSVVPKSKSNTNSNMRSKHEPKNVSKTYQKHPSGMTVLKPQTDPRLRPR